MKSTKCQYEILVKIKLNKNYSNQANPTEDDPAELQLSLFAKTNEEKTNH